MYKQTLQEHARNLRARREHTRSVVFQFPFFPWNPSKCHCQQHTLARKHARISDMYRGAIPIWRSGSNSKFGYRTNVRHQYMHNRYIVSDDRWFSCLLCVMSDCPSYGKLLFHRLPAARVLSSLCLLVTHPYMPLQIYITRGSHITSSLAKSITRKSVSLYNIHHKRNADYKP